MIRTDDAAVKAKQAEVNAAIVSALALAGRADVAIRWGYNGTGVELGIEAPTRGLPRWRVRVGDWSGRAWFQEPKGKAFDYPGIVAACITRHDADVGRARHAKAAAVVREDAARISRALGLSRSRVVVDEESGRIVLRINAVANEEQIRAMVAAARACGLLAAPPMADTVDADDAAGA
jgi:hypothetical protein